MDTYYAATLQQKKTSDEELHQALFASMPKNALFATSDRRMNGLGKTHFLGGRRPAECKAVVAQEQREKTTAKRNRQEEEEDDDDVVE